MTYIDAALLDLIEAACHRFQRLTGRTNVWLAVQLTNLSVIVYFVWAGLYFWMAPLWLRAAVGVFCSGVFYVLTQTVLKVPIEESEQNAYRRVAKGLRNPRRLRDALLRISFLALSIVLPYLALVAASRLRALGVRVQVQHALLTYTLIVLMTILMYLLACDPLPPCVGRVREWLRALQPAPRELPAKADRSIDAAA